MFTAPDAARRLTTARLVAAVLLSLVSVAPLLLRGLVTSHGMLGSALLVAAAVAVLGLACGAVFRNPRPYELAMAVLAYAGVQGKGPLAVAAMSPGMTASVGIALAVSIALVVATTPRLAAASARASV